MSLLNFDSFRRRELSGYFLDRTPAKEHESGSHVWNAYWLVDSEALHRYPQDLLGVYAVIAEALPEGDKYPIDFTTVSTPDDLEKVWRQKIGEPEPPAFQKPDPSFDARSSAEMAGHFIDMRFQRDFTHSDARFYFYALSPETEARYPKLAGAYAVIAEEPNDRKYSVSFYIAKTQAQAEDWWKQINDLLW